MADLATERRDLLQKWAQNIAQLVRGGVFGSDAKIARVDRIAGPRAGALHIWAGVGSGPMLRALAKDTHAVLRQTVPWPFSGSPVAFMRERTLRVEAGWTDSLAQRVFRLDGVSHNPDRADRWVSGVGQCGQTVVMGLTDRTPHVLYAGTTGSGKSVGLQAAVVQLGKYGANDLVLIDGKHGESLGKVAHVDQVVGPVATDIPAARAALGWAAAAMRRRYEAMGGGQDDGRRTIVVFDEFQEMIGDGVIADLFRKLATQGRAARVHLLASTQHPTVDAFGHPATRRCFTGKAAFMVDDAEASRVAVGGNLPRADRLLGEGDGYAIAPGACHRIQGVFVDRRDFSKFSGWQRPVATWGEYDAGDVGQELPDCGRGRSRRRVPSVDELTRAMLSAIAGEGRRAFRARFAGRRPGSDRADWLMKVAGEVWVGIAGSEELRGACACLAGVHSHGVAGGSYE